ncbi:hypothetical protein TcCL_ESM05596 [Trypanosoma cruzi]|nr:hypothetical protein TcCL_ESM05596 [Trypanosoma cruzi]
MTAVESFTIEIASCGTTCRSGCAQHPSPSLLSLSLRTHRWPWHTHLHVRKHLFFLFPRTSHSSTANLISSPFILRILFRQLFRYLNPPTSVHVVSPSGARTTLTVFLIVLFLPHCVPNSTIGDNSSHE